MNCSVCLQSKRNHGANRKKARLAKETANPKGKESGSKSSTDDAPTTSLPFRKDSDPKPDGGAGGFGAPHLYLSRGKLMG